MNAHNDNAIPLDHCTDVEELKTIITQLWQILEDVDGACEFFKLNDVSNFDLFYKHINSCAISRHNILVDDGYQLLIPEFPKEQQ